jgi:chromosome segregation ATPase
MGVMSTLDFNSLLNTENSHDVFMGYFDTENVDGVSSNQPSLNLPGSNAQGKVNPVAKAFAAQSQQRPQEQVPKVQGSPESRLDALELWQGSVNQSLEGLAQGQEQLTQNVNGLTQDVATLKGDVKEIKDYLKVVKNHIDNNLVTKMFMTEQLNELKKEMVTKADLKELLGKKVEEQVIDGKTPQSLG